MSTAQIRPNQTKPNQIEAVPRRRTSDDRSFGFPGHGFTTRKEEGPSFVPFSVLSSATDSESPFFFLLLFWPFVCQ